MQTQNREPPAYQEYASDMLARREYRSMTLAERGLMDTLRRECWVNRTVPADPGLLAKILGYSTDEILAVLPNVMPFFTKAGDDLFCPELDEYRAYLAKVKNAKIEGGKRGADIKNRKRKMPGETRE